MSEAQPAVYVAGPLGFTPYGRQYHDTVVLPAFVAAGLEPLDPWAIPNDPFAAAMAAPEGAARVAALERANRIAGTRNEALIRASAAVVAFLDGSDVDSGTAAEIGFAAALGVPVVGVRLDFRPAGDNEATVVNLQVAHFIESSGGRIESDLAAAIRTVLRILS